jgi:hypothetical protein
VPPPTTKLMNVSKRMALPRWALPHRHPSVLSHLGVLRVKVLRAVSSLLKSLRGRPRAIGEPEPEAVRALLVAERPSRGLGRSGHRSMLGGDSFGAHAVTGGKGRLRDDRQLQGS